MADKLKLMLVDDHYLVRMGLASIVALEPDVVVRRARCIAFTART